MVSETIGPYRIDSRLGAGGMGEVFRAWDDRLERSVAIKLVREGAIDDPQLRQRFLREAKATARMSHPSIVQVFDILERPEGDAIVMEWIDGRTLSKLLVSGPLEIGQALRWGRDLASGLAEAHAQDIVHRDLKSDNVMVTRAGNVKILDFGLAKPLGAQIGAGSLSTTGQIRGTVHAMSPEQAQGFAVDTRSDLFSFGSLLYEMVTGSRPFRASSPLATLGLVISHRQTPAIEVDDRVPKELSQLIDSLLEKEPDHRPQSASEVEKVLGHLARTADDASHDPSRQPTQVTTLLSFTPEETLPPLPKPDVQLGQQAQPMPSKETPDAAWRKLLPLAAILALMILAVWSLVSAWRDNSPTRGNTPDDGNAGELATSASDLRVAALRPSLEIEGTIAAEPELVTLSIRAAMTRSLRGLEGITSLSTSDIDAVASAITEVEEVGPASTRIARALAADELLSTYLMCFELQCSAMVSRIESEAGEEIASREFPIPIDDLSRLSTLVGQNLRLLYPDHDVERGPDLTVEPEDYEEFMQVRWSHEVSPHPGETSERLLHRLEAIQMSSPRFLDAILLEAQITRQRFGASRAPADLERTLDALERARRLAPEDPRALFEAFNLNYRARRWQQASEAARALESLLPGDPSVLLQQAWMLLEQGAPDEAISLARDATRLRPSWRMHHNLAKLLYRVGDMRNARVEAEAALELFPENLGTLSLEAEIASVTGDERALELYAHLVEKRPDSVREWRNFGTTRLLFGQLDEASECFETVQTLAPSAWWALLDHGDVAYLRGRDAEARAYYLEALELGLDTEDAASSGFTQLDLARAHAGLGHHLEAAAAMREALKILGKRAEQSFLAYQAATVHALLGDRTSALASAREALDKGMATRWFHLRWFDELRDTQGFLELLTQADTRARTLQQRAPSSQESSQVSGPRSS